MKLPKKHERMQHAKIEKEKKNVQKITYGKPKINRGKPNESRTFQKTRNKPIFGFFLG
jgi:hypothetical protein